MPRISDEFFFLLVFTIIIISIIVYISAVSQPKEEFVEVYWRVFMVKNLEYRDDLTCKIFSCSKSGIYRLGNIDLKGKIFNVMLTDITEADKYDSLCIDIDKDSIYCDEGEGPFWERDSFFIDSDAFNILKFRKDEIVIAHYPKVVYDQFTIGFNIKSQYFYTKSFNITLFVNESLIDNKVLELKPGEEMSSNFNVSLPSEGLFKVKISVFPLETGEKAVIDFWVEKKQTI